MSPLEQEIMVNNAITITIAALEIWDIMRDPHYVLFKARVEIMPCVYPSSYLEYKDTLKRRFSQTGSHEAAHSFYGSASIQEQILLPLLNIKFLEVNN